MTSFALGQLSTGLTIRSDTNTRFRANVTAIPALNREFVSDRLVNPVEETYPAFLPCLPTNPHVAHLCFAAGEILTARPLHGLSEQVRRAAALRAVGQ